MATVGVKGLTPPICRTIFVYVCRLRFSAIIDWIVYKEDSIYLDPCSTPTWRWATVGYSNVWKTLSFLAQATHLHHWDDINIYFRVTNDPWPYTGNTSWLIVSSSAYTAIIRANVFV